MRFEKRIAIYADERGPSGERGTSGHSPRAIFPGAPHCLDRTACPEEEDGEPSHLLQRCILNAIRFDR
jgi:hypothetical protein